jgi:hypothetical protein
VKQFFRIALGGAAALALVVTFAVGRSSPPVVAAEAAPHFEETWIDAAKSVELKTADVKNSIRQIDLGKVAEPSSLPKPVANERIVPNAPAKMPPVVRVDDEPAARRPRRAERHASEGNNLCTRHKRHKVWVSKYRWRCRR